MPATKVRPKMGRKAATQPAPGSPGYRLRKLLDSLPESKRPSVNELADAAGLSPSRMSDLLNGKSLNPGITVVEKVLIRLGKTFCDYHKAGN